MARRAGRRTRSRRRSWLRRIDCCCGSCGVWCGRRCAPGARAGAVGAARRRHCGARVGVASRNSLRSLRSLRSDNRDESAYAARCARPPRRCAPRRPRPRPRHTPPAAPAALVVFQQPQPQPQPSLCRRGAGPRRARMGWRRGAQGAWPRAQRASWTSSSRLSERSEQRERSEFRDAAMRPSTAGQPSRSGGRRPCAPGTVRPLVGRPSRCMNLPQHLNAPPPCPPC